MLIKIQNCSIELRLWLFEFSRAAKVLFIVRYLHGILPLLTIGLAGPFFSAWSNSVWLWSTWGFLLVAWALAALTLSGEMLGLKREQSFQLQSQVGILWAICKSFHQRNQKTVKPKEIVQEIIKTQQFLLYQLVVDLSREKCLPEGSLSANFMWVSQDDWKTNEETLLVTQQRDRPQENRPKVRSIKIEEAKTGAGLALKSDQSIVETDIQMTGEAKRYGETLPYRSFISVPLRAGDNPVMVLNVDAVSPGAFNLDSDEYKIKQYGYIIMLLELKKREVGR